MIADQVISIEVKNASVIFKQGNKGTSTGSAATLFLYDYQLLRTERTLVG